MRSPAPAMRTPSPAKRSASGGADRRGAAHAARWRAAAGVLLILLAHVLNANVLAPRLAARRAARAGGESDAGGAARLLAESAAAAGLGVRAAGGAGAGAAPRARRDGLTNPLRAPPRTEDEARDPANARPFAEVPLDELHVEKCAPAAALELPHAAGAPGREWVTSSRAWTRLHGGAVDPPRWCRGGGAGEVPDLRLVATLRSARAPRPRSVTVVTQLSLERAHMLEQQCALWPHAVAAAVYIPLLRGRIFSAEEDAWDGAPLAAGVAAMEAVHARTAAPGFAGGAGCALDLEILVEERCTEEDASMYPANAVRNRALFAAATDAVLLLDVDFVVSRSLAESIEVPGGYEKLEAALAGGANALLLPAFEAWDQGAGGKAVALEAAARGKAFVARKFMYNVVLGFHMSHYPQGHERTDFWRWVNATEPYAVEYQTGFEPYILTARAATPYYDERFRGYYWNKVQHLMHVSLQHGVPFVVHPEAFVIHVPHRKPATRTKTRRSGQKERNHVMFLEALEDMRRGRFAPVTAFPHLCLPPALQRAAAEAPGLAEEQRAALREMAFRVEPRAAAAGGAGAPDGAGAAAGGGGAEAARLEERRARMAEELAREEEAGEAEEDEGEEGGAPAAAAAAARR